MIKRPALPFLNWGHLSKRQLRGDVVAGVTVAMLLIPQSMTYAGLAGLPPRYGLLAAVLPLIVTAIFCSSLSAIGPTALTSVVMAAVLAPLAAQWPEEQRPEHYLALAFVLTLLVGLIRIMLGLLRATSIVNLVTLPVSTGFIAASATVIAFSQLPAVLGMGGLNAGNGIFSFIGDLVYWRGPWDGVAAAFGLGTLLFLAAQERWLPRWPGALLLVVLSIIVSRFLQLPERDAGAVIGHIPAGLGTLQLPPLGWESGAARVGPAELRALLPGALLVTFVGFLEMYSVARGIGLARRENPDLDQDMIAQGAGALTAAVSCAYPPSVSLSRSAVNVGAGAASSLANVVAALLVIGVLLWLTPLLGPLPKAVLAGLIVHYVLKLVKFAPLRHAWRHHRREAMVGWGAFILTLLLAPDLVSSFLVACIAAIVVYLYRTIHPEYEICGLGPAAWNPCGPASGASIAVLRFRCAIFFASIGAFERAVMEALQAKPQARHLILVADGVNRFDASGEAALREMVEQFQRQGLELHFAGLPEPALATLRHSGLDQKLGLTHFHPDLEQATAAIHSHLRAATSGDADFAI